MFAHIKKRIIRDSNPSGSVDILSVRFQQTSVSVRLTHALLPRMQV